MYIPYFYMFVVMNELKQSIFWFSQFTSEQTDGRQVECVTLNNVSDWSSLKAEVKVEERGSRRCVVITSLSDESDLCKHGKRHLLSNSTPIA